MMKRITVISLILFLFLGCDTIYEGDTPDLYLDGVYVYKNTSSKPDVLSGVYHIEVTIDYLVIDGISRIEHDYWKDNVDSIVHDHKIIWSK